LHTSARVGIPEEVVSACFLDQISMNTLVETPAAFWIRIVHSMLALGVLSEADGLWRTHGWLNFRNVTCGKLLQIVGQKVNELLLNIYSFNFLLYVMLMWRSCF